MKTDTAFEADLEKSWRDANEYAALLQDSGINALLGPMVIRPDSSLRMKYADKGDLFIPQLRIEVKTRTFSFSGRHDFRYPTVFIDEKYKFDKKAHIPFLCYVTLSQDKKCAAVAYSFTRHHWMIEEKPDPKQGGRLCVNYAIPKEWAHFCSPEKILG